MVKKYCIFWLLCISLYSCNKVNITFTGNSTDTDPNVSYFENYKVNIATMKLDSFSTAGNQVFMVGTHFDSSFGKINASSYSEIQLPAANPVRGTNVSLDSLELVLIPNGNYEGDTNSVYKVSVYRLTENISSPTVEGTSSGLFYPRHFAFDPLPIGQTITKIQPRAQKELDIRLSDALGNDLLTRLKNNDPSIQSQDSFRVYFKGVCIGTDSLVNKSLFYFNGADTTTLLRLYYKERGLNFVEQELTFSYPSQTQFNHIQYNFSGTPFGLFAPYGKQIISSDLMGGKAYINNNIPSYAKITFPDLLTLKGLYPYIKVIQAQLEIMPTPGTYSYPNNLPPTLKMYVSNNNDNLDSVLTLAGVPQTGNLSIDYLYGQNTNYTFDITNYVNEVINEGRFSTKSLLLGANSSLYYNQTSRLIFNDQKGNGIKLKLYVLGL
ncbi:MAG: hypothetical protein ACTHK0_05795 [Ginsengibacter sp.]